MHMPCPYRPATIFAFALLLMGPDDKYIVNREARTHGSMVVYIPTKDGMVVAADSRITMGQIHCDDGVKILPLRRHERSVITVMGFDEVYETRDQVADLCSYRRTHQPIISIPTVIRKFLDSHQGEVNEDYFRKIEAVLIKQVDAIRRAYPNLQPPDPELITSVAYGHYSPRAQTSTYGTVEICKDSANPTRSSVCSREWVQFTLQDPISIKVSGAPDCFQKATSPSGRKLLGPDFLKEYDSLNRHPGIVSMMSNQEALAVGTDMINSTSQYVTITQDSKCGVGGPVKAVLLDEKHTAPFPLQ